MHFPLRTTFAVSHKLWRLMYSFSLVSNTFLIFSLMSLLTYSLFNSVLFNLHEFECFWVITLRLVSVLVPGCMRKCLIWFQLSWICWGLFYVLWFVLSLKVFHVHLKRMCILLLWDELCYVYLLSSFDLVHWSMWQSIHFWQWGVKIP